MPAGTPRRRHLPRWPEGTKSKLPSSGAGKFYQWPVSVHLQTHAVDPDSSLALGEEAVSSYVAPGSLGVKHVVLGGTAKQDRRLAAPGEGMHARVIDIRNGLLGWCRGGATDKWGTCLNARAACGLVGSHGPI